MDSDSERNRFLAVTEMETHFVSPPKRIESPSMRRKVPGSVPFS
jgi:hypothetical protein